MPCDYDEPSLLGPERIICATYRDASGKTCTAPLHCIDIGNGKFALATERPFATHVITVDWHGQAIVPKPGIALHLMSVTYCCDIDATGPDAPSPGMSVHAYLNGVGTYVSKVTIDSAATNVHFVACDVLDVITDPNSYVQLNCTDGTAVLRYREVVV